MKGILRHGNIRYDSCHFAFCTDISRLAEEEKSDQPSLKNLKADLNAR